MPAVEGARPRLDNARLSRSAVLGPSGRGTTGSDTKARPSQAMPCKSRKREGRRERGPVQSVREGVILRRALKCSRGLRPIRAGSKMVEGTLILRKPPPFAGRRRKRIFGQLTATRRSLQPLRSDAVGDPGAREVVRGGALASLRVLRSSALGPRYPKRSESFARRAWLVGHRLRALARFLRWREPGGTCSLKRALPKKRPP